MDNQTSETNEPATQRGANLHGATIDELHVFRAGTFEVWDEPLDLPTVSPLEEVAAKYTTASIRRDVEIVSTGRNDYWPGRAQWLAAQYANDAEGRQLVQDILDRKAAAAASNVLQMQNGQIQQKCPFCNELLTFNLVQVQESTRGEETQFNMSFQTTPESTAHAWSHKEATK